MVAISLGEEGFPKEKYLIAPLTNRFLGATELRGLSRDVSRNIT
jgi:hypothetical protein